VVEGLQKLGIIPRSPSPIALEDRPRESLSREELLQLLARHEAEIATSKKAVKQEKRAEAMRPLDFMKRSRSDHEEELEILPPKRARRNSEIEVIELLDE